MQAFVKSLSVHEFENFFKTDYHCLKWLEKIKWEDGYSCIKCHHLHYCPGSQPLSRQCTKCRYSESPTANTLFHGLKFSLKKAFYIVYFTSSNKKGISSTELSRKLALRQKTCWLFRRKIMTAMSCIREEKLDGNIELGFLFAGKEGIQPTSNTKKYCILAVGKKKDKITEIKALSTTGKSKEEVMKFLSSNISMHAKLESDSWPGLIAATKTYPLTKNYYTNKSKKNLRLFKRTRMMLLGWLRGTHGHARDIQAYVDEYCFRMNHRLKGGAIFLYLIDAMMQSKPVQYKDLETYYSSA